MIKRGCRTTIDILIIILLVFAGIVCLSCDSDSNDEKTGRIQVVVTLLPQAEFVEKVGGELVDVTVMIPSGASPHTYEPIPSQMRALTQATMYAKMGSEIEFEKVWMDRLIDQNTDMLVIDCSENIPLIKMTADHEQEDNHSHESMDPHIWMSPQNTMTIIETICTGLSEVDPENRSHFEENRDAYIGELKQLDQDIKDSLTDVTNRVFMVYHPAFGYFAHEYDLTMLPIEDEGKEPSAKGLAGVIDEAKEHSIKVIFAEPQFDPKSAKVIADEIGGKVVLIDPLSKDYITNIRTILNEMIEAME